MLFFRIFDENFSSETTSIDQTNSFTIGSDLTADVCLIHKSFKFNEINIIYDSVNDSLYNVSSNDNAENENFLITKLQDKLFLITIEDCNLLITLDDALVRGFTYDEILNQSNHLKTNENLDTNISGLVDDSEDKIEPEDDILIDEEYEKLSDAIKVKINSFFSNTQKTKLFGAFGASTASLLLLAIVLFSPQEKQNVAKLSLSLFV